jgi:copper(I)-binding protein
MQIHEMAMIDGVMKMRELPEGLPIPAGRSVTLTPGGYHVMFMDLAQPLVQGETVDLTLLFERAGEVDAPLVVLAPDAERFEAGN